MKLFNGIRSYINEEELKLTILKNKINIMNYIDIGHFDLNKIVVKTSEGEIVIKGNNLTVNKLLSDEILITGNFNNIEFR